MDFIYNTIGNRPTNGCCNAVLGTHSQQGPNIIGYLAVNNTNVNEVHSTINIWSDSNNVILELKTVILVPLVFKCFRIQYIVSLTYGTCLLSKHVSQFR